VGGGGVDGKQRGGTAHRVKFVFGLKRVWWCVKLQLNKGICRNKGWGVFWDRTSAVVFAVQGVFGLSCDPNISGADSRAI
jgi:hypothetical protein